MTPPAPRAPALRLLPLSLLLALSVLAGCVYRPDIQQGNLLRTEDVDQVTVGMTRSQVRYILGTPMVSDPFAPSRWDYVYRLKHGRGGHVDSAHFVVHFEGDKVTRLEKLHVPKPLPPPVDPLAPTREPPPAPSVEQPQPDAPRPGGD
jgi:outer membrane protein assembly factor BamE